MSVHVGPMALGRSQFVDDAAEESDDEGAYTQASDTTGEDEHREQQGAAGYVPDGFVVGPEQADDDDDASTAATAAAAEAEKEQLEMAVDKAELEQEMRELARDHKIEIAQRRKRLRGRAAADEPEEELDDGIAEEAAVLAKAEERQRQKRLAKQNAVAAHTCQVNGTGAPAQHHSLSNGGSMSVSASRARSRGTKYGALWDKRHDMKATERPAKRKKAAKAKVVDLF